MDTQRVVSYVFSLWGGVSAIPAFFPLIDQISNLILVPAADADKAVFLILNTILCYFALFVSFLYQSRHKNLAILIPLFLLGFGGLYWYINLVSPISTLSLLGISADISYLRGYNLIFYKALYGLSFAFLTGAFTSIVAYIYPYRSQSFW
ncbi:MAG: hypothetical protein QY306_13055 [Anaerolineales bacterium]|nr:MAG: hypothetical protein QY306_13055 [Anaerolineales bacterium]